MSTQADIVSLKSTGVMSYEFTHMKPDDCWHTMFCFSINHISKQQQRRLKDEKMKRFILHKQPVHLKFIIREASHTSQTHVTDMATYLFSVLQRLLETSSSCNVETRT